MKHKKAAFDSISNMMIGFVGFILIVILCIMMLSVFKSTSLVCANDIDNRTTIISGGACYSCLNNGTSASTYNSTDGRCYNGTSAISKMSSDSLLPYPGAAYNATISLTDAALLPPQFASLIVIVVIIIGILAMLGAIGYSAYQRMKQ